MPYGGQGSGTLSQDDIVRNPDVQRFLERCEDIPRPTPEELNALLEGQPHLDDFTGELPRYIIAIDGSSYESSLDPNFPSRRIGYVKISMVILRMEDYQALHLRPSRFVDPMAVARLGDQTAALSMALPGAYMRMKGASSVEDGFRHALLEYYRSPSTALSGRTLYDTLFEVAGKTARVNAQDEMLFSECPNRECRLPEDVELAVPKVLGVSTCPHCGQSVYATDILRVHEDFLDTAENISSLNRLMVVTEHLLAMHYLLHLYREDRATLGQVGIILDGPLAIFGGPAPMHRGIMRLLDEIAHSQVRDGHSAPLVMGLTKTGTLAEHGKMLRDLMPDGVVFPIRDDYRYTFVDASKAGQTVNYGKDTYYGQDFLVKTRSGKVFPLCLAYPFAVKAGAFKTQKVEIIRYAQMGRALKVLETLETDLYQDALIPVVLAHRHASISLTPGGRVLDLLGQEALRRGRSR